MRALAARLALLLGLWLGQRAAAAPVAVPPAPQGRVSDYAGVLQAGERAALEAQLGRYEREVPAEGGAPQIAVITVPSLEGEPVEDVALRFAERWKIGSRADDGVILLVATGERKVRIEVGYGAEGRLPDAVASRIIREIVAPHLKAGAFAAGLGRGAAAIHQALTGKAVTGADADAGLAPVAPESPVEQRRVPWGTGGAGLGLLVLLLILGAMGRGRGGPGRGLLWGLLLGSIFGGRRGGGGGGGFRGGGGGFGGGGASGDY